MLASKVIKEGGAMAFPQFLSVFQEFFISKKSDDNPRLMFQVLDLKGRVIKASGSFSCPGQLCATSIPRPLIESQHVYLYNKP